MENKRTKLQETAGCLHLVHSMFARGSSSIFELALSYLKLEGPLVEVKTN